MYKERCQGFTLMELITVVIIVGVLAVVGITQFSTSRERAIGKEAQANLRLIQTAEKIYKMEQGGYYPGSPPEGDAGEINKYLKLSLGESNWDYSITAAGAGSFTAQADRVGSGGYLNCTYTITQAAGSNPTPSSITDCPQ